MNSIELEKPVLFLEFYIREVTYHEKDSATKFPPHTLFYKGKSLAVLNPNADKVAEYYKMPYGQQKIFGFADGSPFLLDERNVEMYFTEQVHKKESVDTVWLQGEEFFSDICWYRNYDRIQFSYSHYCPYLVEITHKAPFGFSVIEVNEEGVVKTNFPRREIIYNLDVGQTYLFLCRQEQFSSGDWYTPNKCVMLYVKNHGLHQQIRKTSAEKIIQLDPARLCEEDVKVRDHRKSRLKYELG